MTDESEDAAATDWALVFELPRDGKAGGVVRVRSGAGAVVVAVAVATGLTGCGGSGRAGLSLTPRPPASAVGTTVTATTTPTPTATVLAAPALGMAVSSVTFVSAQDGWVIGQIAGRTRVERTSDGGAHWTPLAASPPGNPTGIRFADGSHGYVFNRSALDITSDGGASWRQVAIPDEDGPADGTGAADVVTAAGRVWLLNAAAPYPSIYTAPVGSTAFRRVGQAGDRGAYLKVHGGEAYVVGTQGAGPVPPDLQVATATGVAARKSPCSGVSGNGDFTGLAPTTTAGSLYAVCGGVTSSSMPASPLYRLSDDARTYSGVTVLHECAAVSLAVTTSAAYIACQARGVQVVPLTAGSQRAVLPGVQVQYLGFTNDQDGVAISGVAHSQSSGGDLYLTRDGGTHWTKAAT